MEWQFLYSEHNTEIAVFKITSIAAVDNVTIIMNSKLIWHEYLLNHVPLSSTLCNCKTLKQSNVKFLQLC